MTYNNYSISASKGKLYLKAKTETPGYEKVTYGTNGESVTWHQYHDSIKGTPQTLEVKEIQYEGKTLKFLELTLVDGENHNKVSAPLKNVKGNYTDEVKAILSALNGLEMGQEVTFTTKATTSTGKNGKEYKNLNVYINYTQILNESGKDQGTGFIPYTDIPAPIEKMVAGDKTWDFSPQTEFYYAKLGEIQTKFQSGEDANPQQQAPASDKKDLPKVTPDAAFDKTKSFAPDNKTNLPF